MAIDYKGQPITNQTAFKGTTGIMNKKPKTKCLKPLKMPTNMSKLNLVVSKSNTSKG